MRCVSTRGGAPAVSAPEAVLRGIAPDGGLYAPERFPRFSLRDIVSLSKIGYAERASRVISPFFEELGEGVILPLCEGAYSRFDSSGPAPVKYIGGGDYAMELFHGPTLAFKDLALSLLPGLLAASAERLGEKSESLVLVATSGDTGKAALSGFSGVDGTRCVVFYPEGGVSEAQRLQMVTQAGGNVHVVAVRGDFDAAQRGVKRIFADGSIRDKVASGGRALTSANSINLGRLIPQIAYYLSAYADMVASGAVRAGEDLSFCVPTGNFGNILAAYYAMRMGLPVGRLICASNRNDVLTDFISTGVYDANRELRKTDSPSMDIIVSSNLERLLFESSGRDGGEISGFMESLRARGEFRVGGEVLADIKRLFWGASVGDAAARGEIAMRYRDSRYLPDPHTAVALRALRDYRAETGDESPCVAAATASPFKFGRAVASALLPNADGDDFALCAMLSDFTGIPVPPQIAALPESPIIHRASCLPEGMEGALIDILDAAAE